MSSLQTLLTVLVIFFNDWVEIHKKLNLRLKKMIFFSKYEFENVKFHTHGFRHFKVKFNSNMRCVWMYLKSQLV